MLGSGSRRQVELDTMFLLERGMLGYHLNHPRPEPFLSKGDRVKQKVFLTFYETFLQICNQHSRGPQGWRSWTEARLLELCTTAWRPETANGAECYWGRRLFAWLLIPGGLVPRLSSERTPKITCGTQIEAVSNQDSSLTGQEITSSPQPGFPPQTLGVLLVW